MCTTNYVSCEETESRKIRNRLIERIGCRSPENSVEKRIKREKTGSFVEKGPVFSHEALKKWKTLWKC